jgi:hypothetical protein
MGKEGLEMQFREMDERVTYMHQLQQEGGPIVLVNVFSVEPEDAARLVEVWAEDAAFMKEQPGFISASCTAARAAAARS